MVHSMRPRSPSVGQVLAAGKSDGCTAGEIDYDNGIGVEYALGPGLGNETVKVDDGRKGNAAPIAGQGRSNGESAAEHG